MDIDIRPRRSETDSEIALRLSVPRHPRLASLSASPLIPLEAERENRLGPVATSTLAQRRELGDVPLHCDCYNVDNARGRMPLRHIIPPSKRPQGAADVEDGIRLIRMDRIVEELRHDRATAVSTPRDDQTSRTEEETMIATVTTPRTRPSPHLRSTVVPIHRRHGLGRLRTCESAPPSHGRAVNHSRTSPTGNRVR